MIAATTCPVASAAAQAPEQLPFELPFSSDRGGIAGTGFTLRQEPGGALLPDLLTLDTATGVLRIRTTPGIAIRAQDSQDNALGVTLSADQRAMILETVLLLPPSGTSRFEQAGIWYGTSQDDYVKVRCSPILRLRSRCGCGSTGRAAT
jgi:large repetitive protein